MPDSESITRVHRPDNAEGKLPFGKGDIVAGKYRVESVLGAGMMGVVLAATHLALGQRVAIKFLHGEASKDLRTTERFQREAKSAVRLKSEHVARVLDVGSLDDGAPYMVMEYLDGSDLRAVAAAGATLPFHDAVEYLVQVCDAVGEAHVLGITHRDLKPENLFLTRKSKGRVCVKVLDFGIAKTEPAASSGDLSALTRTKVMLGSPYYMSPEQLVSSRDVDVRTDVWSLGVCLYQFVTGRVPYDGDTLLSLGLKVLHEPPVAPQEYRKDIPPELAAIILRCLEKDPANRYANAGELGTALEHLLVSWGSTGIDQPSTPPSAPSRTEALADATGGHERGPVLRVAFGTFFGVLLIVGGIFYAARWRLAHTSRSGPRSVAPAATASVSAPRSDGARSPH